MADPTNPMPAAKPGLGGESAAGPGNLRPDAEREDPGTRAINPFKQALNVIMFGSRDPSHADVGEMRAGHIQRKYISDALLAAPPGDPARAQVVATMGAMGAQAAQSMRERYYAKEYKQMVSTQIVPIKEQIESMQAEARDRLAISTQAVPRLMGVQEGAELAAADQMSTPAAPEIVSKGKTAEGKDKGQEAVPGVAPPTPNPTITPGQIGATTFDPETPSLMDPITGQPVPIASARGIQIEQEVTNEFLENQNAAMLKMMDVLASYGGNPYASEALQKMIEGTSQMAGAAVTGRSDPKQQQEWWEGRQQHEADLASKTSEANQKLLNLQQDEAATRAQAADAVQMANSDSDFFNSLGKSVQKALKAGKGVEDMTPTQLQDLAAMSSMQRDLQVKELETAKKAGLIAVAPARFNSPNTWHNWMDSNDARYQALEQEKFAQMTTGLEQEIGQVQGMKSEHQEQFFKDYRVPSDVRMFIRQGNTTEKPVIDWINRHVQGSAEYEDAKAEAYMERLEYGLQEQDGLEGVMRAHNDEFLRAYAERFPNATPYDLEEMRIDVLGTHYLSTHDRNAPNWRPMLQGKQINDWRTEQEVLAGGGGEVIREGAAAQVDQQMTPDETDQLLRDMQARPALGNEPNASEYLQRMDVATMPDEEVSGTTSPAAMSQPQLSDQIDRLHRMLMLPEVMSDLNIQQRIHKRMAELREHHVNVGEKMLFNTIGALYDQFTTSPEEQAEADEQRRIREGEILRFVPGQKVN